MTERKRWFCRFVTVVTLLVATVPTVARADSGPKNEVQALRGAELARAHHSVTVTDVAIVQPYALLMWRDAHSGGEALWRRTHSNVWTRITGGGVPAHTAQELLRRQHHV